MGSQSMARKRTKAVITSGLLALAILAALTQLGSWRELERARRAYVEGDYLSSFIRASKAKSLMLISGPAVDALENAGDALVKEIVDQMVDSLRNGGWPPKDVTFGAWGDARIRFKDEAGLGYATVVGTLRDRVLEVHSGLIGESSHPMQSVIEYDAKQNAMSKLAEVLENELPSPEE